MATRPVISVVVPTHNRRDRLEHLLDALAQQRDAPPFEVVVVDDGSDDGTIDVLRRMANQSPFPLVSVRLERNAGPATARNIGWRRAVSPLIAFTDDDCAPRPGWLSSLASALADGRADVVQGPTVPDPDQLWRRNTFSHSILIGGDWGFYETCNIAYRRELLEALDGFDEGFQARPPGKASSGPIFGEDADLAWRAKRAGARIAFEPDALVLHDVRPQRYIDHLRSMRRREGIVRAVKRNPEMRGIWSHGVFWQPGHAEALWAALGLVTAALGRRSRRSLLAGAALCVPYIRYRTIVAPTGRPRNRPAVIPMCLASDLTEVGVMAAASIRYRTLVL